MATTPITIHEPRTEPLTCINCRDASGKLVKGLCQKCYNYQRRHGGARPVVLEREPDALPEGDGVRATPAVLAVPDPTDQAQDGHTVLPPDVPPMEPDVSEVPTQTDDQGTELGDPSTGALDAIMALASEGRAALRAALQDGRLRWRAPRTVPGTGSRHSKISEDDVRLLRQDFADGMNFTSLARKYAMSPMAARACALRLTHKDVE